MAINIICAVYGTNRKGKEVTSIVQRIVEDGNDDIPVNNESLGGDPDRGPQKYFGVYYEITHKDKPSEKRVRCAMEGQTLDLC